jgi:hypothetical protein
MRERKRERFLIFLISDSNLDSGCVATIFLDKRDHCSNLKKLVHCPYL